MRTLGWLMCVSLFLASTGYGASFECEKAKEDDEKTICAHPEISKLDEEMAAAYRARLRAVGDWQEQEKLREEQRLWLEGRCREPECLIESYRTRITSLRSKGPFRVSYMFPTNMADDFRLCTRYTENLNTFPASPSMLCERKLNPAFTEFRRPQWRTWTSEEFDRRLPLFRELVRVSLVSADAKAEFEQRYEWYLARARRGELTVQEAKVLADETWVRFGLRRPEDTDWSMKLREKRDARRKRGQEEDFQQDIFQCSWIRYARLNKDGSGLTGAIYLGGGATDILIHRRSDAREYKVSEMWADVDADMSQGRLGLGAVCIIDYRRSMSNGEEK